MEDAKWYFTHEMEEDRLWYRIFFAMCRKFGVSWSKASEEQKVNEARFSNIFIEKRASTCPQSLEKSRLFSYALLVSECENFQNMKRIFLRKVVI